MDVTRVSISSTKGFLDAIERFIDENKPDPLSLKQLSCWSLEWKDSDDQDFPLSPSHALKGTLRITGEYLVVSLIVTCSWSTSDTDDSHGTLYYSCRASAKVRTKSEWKKSRQADGYNNNTKANDKVRSKMIKRLQQDAYISKILIQDNSDDKQKTKREPPILAQAKIIVDDTGLEERVDVSEAICEAIKRSIWSSAESPLDIIDLILQFPCLPTIEHQDIISTTTKLANRAKLRLLEDAMVDACEQEGEDEILQDLAISTKKDTYQGNKEGRKRTKFQ